MAISNVSLTRKTNASQTPQEANQNLLDIQNKLGELITLLNATLDDSTKKIKEAAYADDTIDAFAKLKGTADRWMRVNSSGKVVAVTGDEGQYLGFGSGGVPEVKNLPSPEVLDIPVPHYIGGATEQYHAEGVDLTNDSGNWQTVSYPSAIPSDGSVKAVTVRIYAVIKSGLSQIDIWLRREGTLPGSMPEFRALITGQTDDDVDDGLSTNVIVHIPYHGSRTFDIRPTVTGSPTNRVVALSVIGYWA